MELAGTPPKSTQVVCILVTLEDGRGIPSIPLKRVTIPAELLFLALPPRTKEWNTTTPARALAPRSTRTPLSTLPVRLVRPAVPQQLQSDTRVQEPLGLLPSILAKHPNVLPRWLRRTS